MKISEIQHWTELADEFRGLVPLVHVFCEIQLPAGKSFHLEPAQMPAYCADPIGFCARHFQTTPERFSAWLIYYEEKCQCTGITHSGRQCNSGGQLDVHPSRFVPGESDRCFHHMDISK